MITNPYLASAFSLLSGTEPKTKTEYGHTSFVLPLIVNSPYTDGVDVFYNATGYDPLSANSPILISVAVNILENSKQYQILTVFVKPDNAFEVPSEQTTSSTPIPSIIFTVPSNITMKVGAGLVVVGQRWSGKSFVEIATSGFFGATVDIFMLPSMEFRSQTFFQPWGHFHDEIVTIPIAESGVSQQQVFENENLSLTFFILFFASFDVAVTLYDHSFETIQGKSNETSKQNSVNGDYCQAE